MKVCTNIIGGFEMVEEEGEKRYIDRQGWDKRMTRFRVDIDRLPSLSMKAAFQTVQAHLYRLRQLSQ